MHTHVFSSSRVLHEKLIYHRWFKRSTRKKRPVTREIIIIIIIIIK